jgi:hypothetical protein
MLWCAEAIGRGLASGWVYRTHHGAVARSERAGGASGNPPPSRPPRNRISKSPISDVSCQ